MLSLESGDQEEVMEKSVRGTAGDREGGRTQRSRSQWPREQVAKPILYLESMSLLLQCMGKSLDLLLKSGTPGPS